MVIAEPDTVPGFMSPVKVPAVYPIPGPTLSPTCPAVYHSYQVLYLPQKGTQFCWNVVMLHLRLLCERSQNRARLKR